MKRPKRLEKTSNIAIFSVILAVIGFAMLLFYHLGSLTPGLSSTEVQSAISPVGFHGIYHDAFYLPLKLLRSLDFFLFKHHGPFLTRLPNVLLGGVTILAFAALIYLWHGRRTAILSTILFACSAWTLHVTRLASFDVMYFLAITLVLLGYAALHKIDHNPYVWYSNILLIGLLFTIPGLLWLALLTIYLERSILQTGFSALNTSYKKIISVLLLIIWLPLVAITLAHGGLLKQWIGLPEHYGSATHVIKNFVAVPVHLLIRGPENPQLWIGKAPLLDGFTLVMSLIGVYYYATHYKNSRSRFIGSIFLLSAFLVGLNGAVGFSLLVPFMYLMAAMGMAYLLHAWNKVFPHNPIARGVGIGLVIVAVIVSCAYNLRSYYVAWPNDPTTYTTFGDRD